MKNIYTSVFDAGIALKDPVTHSNATGKQLFRK